MFFSPSTAGFYSSEIHGAPTMKVIDPNWVRPDKDGQPDADAEPSLIEVPNPLCMIPADAVQISTEQHAALLTGQSHGKRITAGPDGLPVLVDPPPPDFAVIKAAQLANFRVEREKILNRLAGIGLRAMNSGKSELVGEISKFSEGLLKMPSSPAVAVAKNGVELKAALDAGYQALVIAASIEARAAFKGVDA